ncbi:MAG: protein translocase subunit SecF [Coxiellaceae bacterium]|jgi:preprotein translocase subunit SecF|nr:protein translocase subunit SecF [Coxiellaceae bacterium]
MEFFTHNTNIDFMSQRKWAFLFSVTLIFFSVWSLIFNGLNLGLDFTGGIQIEVNYDKPPDCNQIRQRLRRIGLEAIVQAYGSSSDIMIKLKLQKYFTQQQMIETVLGVLTDAKLQRAEMIGAQIGKKLVTDGILAIIIALLGTMVYITLRFEYRFAVSAIISLIHDPILILGLFSFFHVEFDSITLAALLTVIGYSLNDTIVVYDRARENFRKIRKATPAEILNLSINQTLSRTMMISGLTLVVVIALLVYGGPMLKGFSLAMIIGIVIGTYSSIYVAGALALFFGLDRHHLLITRKKIIDTSTP